MCFIRFKKFNGFMPGSEVAFSILEVIFLSIKTEQNFTLP